MKGAAKIIIFAAAKDFLELSLGAVQGYYELIINYLKVRYGVYFSP